MIIAPPKGSGTTMQAQQSYTVHVVHVQYIVHPQ